MSIRLLHPFLQTVKPASFLRQAALRSDYRSLSLSVMTTRLQSINGTEASACSNFIIPEVGRVSQPLGGLRTAVPGGSRDPARDPQRIAVRCIAALR